MSRMAKLTLACIFGGMLLAALLVPAMRPPPGPSIDPAVVEIDAATDRLAPELRRCRNITVPEASCDAVWEAQRRRFFHPED